jgi:P pilus assembly/Cpx signaling pathway, periplasmic inhibitor/zinc-resistance associated protein
MKKMMCLCMALLFSSSFIAADVFAAKASGGSSGKQSGMYNGFERKFKQHKNQLNLEQAQTESIEKLDKESAEKFQAARQNIGKLNGDKSEAISNKNFDRAREITTEISAQEAVVEKMRVDYIERISKILTPTQYKALEELISKTISEKRARSKEFGGQDTNEKSTQKGKKQQGNQKKVSK